MAVLHLVRPCIKDTISTLRVLLAMAVKGQLRGVAVYYRMDDGSEDSVFTGVFKSHPASGVNAGMRLSWALTQAQDRISGPP